jgi:hypothetical protein
MSGLIIVLCLAVWNDSFIADATSEKEFLVLKPESVVKTQVADIQILRRNMPGVVAITEHGEGKWLYKTERRMPLSDVIKTDFVLARNSKSGGVWQTPDIDAPNWMSFRLETRPVGSNQTAIKVRVRIRLVREDGAAIHVFAPLLGEAFISDRMQDDLESMLDAFASSVRREIEGRASMTTVTDREQ